MNQIPFNTNSQGSYSLGLITGILPVIGTLGANAEIAQFRFVSSVRACYVRRVRVSAVVSTTFFAAGVPVQLGLVKSTAWTGQGTGGTGITPAALLKRRTTMQSTVIAAGDIRIATTAALGAGTKTLETLHLATLAAPGPITASLNGQIIAPGTVLWEAGQSDGDHPLLLTNNEGLSVTVINAPATGTWTASVAIDWVELIDEYTPSAV